MNLKKKKLIDYYLGGNLIIILKPIFLLVGSILKRDHYPIPRGDIVVMKILGGGSLILAMPALLGIRKKNPDRKMHLVTTKTIQPFAETMGIFDQIHLIDDSGGIFDIIFSSIKVLRSVFRVDTFIDLEVYSRLSTIFSGLSAARNRIGFYLQEVFWRSDIQTHLVFFNPQSNVYYAYSSCAELIGAKPALISECRKLLKKRISTIPALENIPENYMVIGHTCSDLSLERMLSPSQWKITLQRLVKEKIIAKDMPIIFLGATNDFDKAEAIIREISPVLKNPFLNVCGKYRLIESIKIISEADYFVGIDSALLHYARLLSIQSHSYWGPTNPNTLLMPIEDYQEKVTYKKIPCSPCTHITEVPPCNGKAFCIKNLFEDNPDREIFTLIYNQSRDLRNRLNKKSIHGL